MDSTSCHLFLQNRNYIYSPHTALVCARKAYAAKAFQRQYLEKINVHLL